jgi:hypothetical protein
MSQVKDSGETMRTKPRNQKVSKISQRGGPKIFLWRLQDEVFFQRFAELNGAQICFYLGLRKSWMPRGGTAVIVERTPRMAEFADEEKDIQRMIDLGFIVREDARSLARRIKATRMT